MVPARTARPAGRWEPAGLGVHPVTGGGPLPAYIRRPHDEVLRRVLDPEVADSRLIVVRRELEDPQGVARLLAELRAAGAGNAVRVLLARDPAGQVSLGPDQQRGVARLLTALRGRPGRRGRPRRPGRWPPGPPTRGCSTWRRSGPATGPGGSRTAPRHCPGPGRSSSAPDQSQPAAAHTSGAP